MFMNFPPFLPCSNRRRLDPRKQDDGFTLTELLVVIGTIALLAVTLLPALAGTKIGTKNIQCLNNLRQLTSGALMYQSDNGTISWGQNISQLWMATLRSAQISGAIQLCPFAMAPTQGATPNYQGTANNAWVWAVPSDPNNPNSPLVATNGSYGLNGWLYKYTGNMVWINPSDAVNFFPSATAIKHPSQTPMFVDSLWPDLWPYQGGSPDDHNGSWELYDDNGRANAQTARSIDQGMARCCIARHSGSGPIGSAMRVAGRIVPLWNGGVNISCADGHVEPTTLEGLWSYYWNANAVPATRPTH